jgi:hypothetical protein
MVHKVEPLGAEGFRTRRTLVGGLSFILYASLAKTMTAITHDWLIKYRVAQSTHEERRGLNQEQRWGETSFGIHFCCLKINNYLFFLYSHNRLCLSNF